ncbi:hypothetical protein HAN_3g524 (nucleomorph) [Hemiselmis andersenii]|uniref:Uncharacterized protein n=1 Tax=Hemiselmis andersenii TaxID=464988 RepID=A9BLE0_HEMAN|nr:hypothetical protein HAN_3g524 [Hemiselmis andersenii]ABW98323.1 hypothetical protein HAN_3g524 [Hemiselmis andersenii]|mmetsp:Transcript_27291/g.66481  ORF Transcript_27291/g.66481 Transcript_27291/m.66481 type:complete len:280 (-) Transcript_27291:273-1112(-)
MQYFGIKKCRFLENFHLIELHFLFWIFFLKFSIFNSWNLGNLKAKDHKYFLITNYGWYSVQILKFFEKIIIFEKKREKFFLKIIKIFFFFKSNSVFFLFWNFEFFQEINKYWYHLSKITLKNKNSFYSIFHDLFTKWFSVYIKNNPLIDLKFFNEHSFLIGKLLKNVKTSGNLYDWKFFFFNFYFIVIKTFFFFSYGKYLEKTSQEKLKTLTDSFLLKYLTNFFNKFKTFFSVKQLDCLKKLKKKKIWLLHKKKFFIKKSTVIRKKKIQFEKEKLIFIK